MVFFSETTTDSLTYTSSDVSEGLSEEWHSDWSTDTEDMIKRNETEAVSSPKLIAGRIMTSNSHEDLSRVPGPSSSRMNTTNMDFTPKLGKRYFDSKLCYALLKNVPKKELSSVKQSYPRLIHLCHHLLVIEDL